MKLWAALSLVLVLSTLTFGQETGSITGTVRDSSGAVIPNASVAVTNPATSVTRDLTSNSEGDYLAAGLPPGTYDVTVTAKGFQKYHVSGVVLRVAQKARVDANLPVGQAENVITVQGEQVAQVQTQSSEVAGTVTGQEITQLQLNGRSIAGLDFDFLAGGALSAHLRDEGVLADGDVLHGEGAFGVAGCGRDGNRACRP